MTATSCVLAGSLPVIVCDVLGRNQVRNSIHWSVLHVSGAELLRSKHVHALMTPHAACLHLATRGACCARSPAASRQPCQLSFLPPPSPASLRLARACCVVLRDRRPPLRRFAATVLMVASAFITPMPAMSAPTQNMPRCAHRWLSCSSSSYNYYSTPDCVLDVWECACGKRARQRTPQTPQNFGSRYAGAGWRAVAWTRDDRR